MVKKRLCGYRTIPNTGGKMKISSRRTPPSGYEKIYSYGGKNYFHKKKPRSWKE
jgi:hypothetical protein